MPNRMSLCVQGAAAILVLPLIASAQAPTREVARRAKANATSAREMTSESTLTSANPNEATAASSQVYFNNFDGTETLASGVIGGVTWAGAAESVQGFSGLGQTGSQFGGNFWRNAATGRPAQASRLILTGIPPHKGISLHCLLAIIDSWDGGTGSSSPDYFNVAVNGTTVFSQSFDIVTPNDQGYVAPPGGQLTYNTQRGFNASYNDAAYDMTLDPILAELPHSAGILAIDFFASGGGWEGGANESWAIDNLEVLISDVGPDPVPTFTDAISREVSVFQAASQFQFTDTVSREISVFTFDGPNPIFTDAISREISVFTTEAEIEPTDANSREISVFSVIPIALGGPYIGTLTPGTWLYFSVNTPADQTLRVDLDHASTTAWTELYASFNKLPDDASSDFVFTSPSAPDQVVTIPNTQAGTYYFLVRVTNDSNPLAPHGFSLLAVGVPFGVDTVHPPIVGAGEEVTLRVTGGHLDSASSIRLRPSGGGTDITPITTTIADSAHARLRFNLLGAPLGEYDVISVSPTEQRVLARAVTLESPLEPLLEQQVTSAAGMARRHGLIQGTATVVLRNTGNVDVPFVRFNVFAHADPNLSLYVDAGAPDPFSTGTDFMEGRFLISSLAVGEEITIPIQINLLRGYERRSIDLFVDVQALTRSQVLEGILLREGGWFDRYFDFLRQQPAWTPDAEEEIPLFRQAVREYFLVNGFNGLNGTGQTAGEVDTPSTSLWCRLPCGIVPAFVCARICPTCVELCIIIGVGGTELCNEFAPNWCLDCDDERFCNEWETCFTCPGHAWECCKKLCTWELRPAARGSSVLDCKKECQDMTKIPYNCSADPNEKLGQPGFGEELFVDSRKPLTYRVYFENMETATAPAAEVTITDSLDFGLDVSSFRINEFHFGETTVAVPEGRSSFQSVLDLTSEMDLLVQLEGSLDSPTHKATFTLRALDPQTRQVPSELDRGFLPPNDDTGRGEGYVEFTIKPLVSAVHTGTVIKNKAPIVFDYNNPIWACAPGEQSDPDCVGWFNTIDAAAPSSFVDALPTKIKHGKFNVCWSGQDDPGGSGIANFVVFASHNTSPYVLWNKNNEVGCAAFTGASVGQRYSFYSIAQDNVGHSETTPQIEPQTGFITPDATTTIRFGDFNGDGVANLSDYFHPGQSGLQPCLTGPGQTTSCEAEDFNLDGRVDLLDFAAFQIGFGAPQ